MITSEPTSASSIVVIETVSNVVNADLSPCSSNLTASSVCECADIVDKGHFDASAEHIVIVQMTQSDPALWNLQDSNEKSIIIRNGPTIYQNDNDKFLKSRRQYMSFNNKTQKPVIVSRLLYSALKVSAYCFPCRLFSKKKRTFASNDITDWKHLNLITEHERGPEHSACMIINGQRQK